MMIIGTTHVIHYKNDGEITTLLSPIEQLKDSDADAQRDSVAKELWIL